MKTEDDKNVLRAEGNLAGPDLDVVPTLPNLTYVYGLTSVMDKGRPVILAIDDLVNLWFDGSDCFAVGLASVI